MEGNSSPLSGHGAEQIFQHLVAVGAVQTGDTQHLTLFQLESSVLQPGIFSRNMLDVQDHLSRLVGLGREAVGQLTAHHQPDDLVHGQLLGRFGSHPGAVPHNGDIITDPQDLLHLVADIDDAAASVPQHIDDPEQVLHFSLCQGGGGLVKNDNLGIIGYCLGNLHHLALGNGQRGHHSIGVHLYL